MLFLKKIGKGAYARLIPHGLIGYTPYGCHTGRTPLYPLGSSQTGFVYVRQFYFQPSVTFGYARSALYGVFPLSLRGLPSPSTEAIDRLLSDLSLSLSHTHQHTHHHHSSTPPSFPPARPASIPYSHYIHFKRKWASAARLKPPFRSRGGRDDWRRSDQPLPATPNAQPPSGRCKLYLLLLVVGMYVN